MNLIKIDIIEEFFDKIIKYPRSCAEVRCMNARVDDSGFIVYSKYPTTVAGWFDRSDALSSALYRVKNVSSYITYNPVSISRRPIDARNKLQILKAGDFCCDKDIIKIRWCIIDIDPAKPSPTSLRGNSSQSELEACIQVRNKIMSETGIDSRNSLCGTSGNGAFILVRLPDWDNTEDHVLEIYNFLCALGSRYSNKYVEVDVQAKNPSRLIGIPGTWKYRDQLATLDRPHRLVEIHDYLGDTDERSNAIIRPDGLVDGQSV